MPGRDLATLLASLDPVLHDGSFVFTTLAAWPSDVRAVATILEEEGTSVVLEQGDADRLALTYSFVSAWITLRVDSALDAVGLTAAVATALSGAGIAANVVAGHHHDHLFVSAEAAGEAITLLRRLGSEAVREAG